MSGGLTGALLAIRSGPKIMAGSAILGSVILAMIEGVGLLTTRMMGAMADPTAPPVNSLVFLHAIFKKLSTRCTFRLKTSRLFRFYAQTIISFVDIFLVGERV